MDGITKLSAGAPAASVPPETSARSHYIPFSKGEVVRMLLLVRAVRRAGP